MDRKTSIPTELLNDPASYENEEYDRIFTYLTLMDYDWVYHRIQAVIPLNEKDILKVEFKYSGFTSSEMTVVLNDERARYDFSTDIFNELLTEYLNKQIKMMNSEFAFFGGDIIIKYYNKVMKEHTNVSYDESKIEKIKFPKC